MALREDPPMTATLQTWTDADGKRTAIDPAAPCLGCGVEPEVRSYFTRTLTRTADKVAEVVRVGYHCTCGTIVVDGMAEGVAH